MSTTDIRGKAFEVGQKVARAAISGNSARLYLQEVTRVEGGHVYLDHSPQYLRLPTNVVIL